MPTVDYLLPAFMEDVYECLPLDELEDFYTFFIQKLMKIPIVSGRTDNISILKVCNSMMKRMSKGPFSELRGK
jgi:hypothetical protein